MMNGSGTQADPYLITTCQELLSFLKTMSGYAKLTKNLDCNDDGLLEWDSGSNIRNGNKEVDFNGHYLANVFIPENGNFYHGYYNGGKAHFKNGAIINVYEQAANMFTRDATFFNFALDIKANTFHSVQGIIRGWGSGTIFDYCNVRITNVNVNNQGYWLSCENNHFFATNSKLTLNGVISSEGSLYEGISNSSTQASAFKNCLIEGKLTGGGTKPLINYSQNNRGAICVGTIFRVNLTECACPSLFANNSNSVNIIDSSTYNQGFSLGSDIKSLTDAQIRSHNKLDEIGFDTVEVIE